MKKRVSLYPNVFHDCLTFGTEYTKDRLRLMNKKLWLTLLDLGKTNRIVATSVNFLTCYFYMSKYPKECVYFSKLIAKFGYIKRVLYWNEMNKQYMNASYIKYSLWNDILTEAASGGHISSLKIFGVFVGKLAMPNDKEDWLDPLKKAVACGHQQVCTFIINTKYVSTAIVDYIKKELYHCSDPDVIECLKLLEKVE